VLEQELGALGPARRHYEQAISLLNEVQDARLRAIALGNLGALEAESSNWLAARQCHEQALELLLPLDDRRSEALCRARLAAAHAVLGLCKEADAEFGRALTDRHRVEARRCNGSQMLRGRKRGLSRRKDRMTATGWGSCEVGSLSPLRDSWCW